LVPKGTVLGQAKRQSRAPFGTVLSKREFESLRSQIATLNNFEITKCDINTDGQIIQDARLAP
jgi:hypothetical protein